jgi:hypothetical protein
MSDLSGQEPFSSPVPPRASARPRPKPCWMPGATVIAHYGGDRAGAEAATGGAAHLLQADFHDLEGC